MFFQKIQIYERGKNLKGILSPSLFSATKSQAARLINNINERCNICTKIKAFNNTFKCSATGKYCKVKGTLSCNAVNVVFLITCHCCKLQCFVSKL